MGEEGEASWRKREELAQRHGRAAAKAQRSHSASLRLPASHFGGHFEEREAHSLQGRAPVPPLPAV